MAKKKKGRKRQGLFSKAVNLGGWAIGLARPIQIFFQDGFTSMALQRIMNGLTFGLSDGSLNVGEGLQMYVPVGASIGYRQLTTYLMRHFPVR